MSFTTAEYIQGLLLEIEKFHDEVPPTSDLDKKAERFVDLGVLADAVDVAVGGFGDGAVTPETEVPNWLVHDPERPRRGLKGLVDRLRDPDDCAELVEYASVAAEKKGIDETDFFRFFVQLLDALGDRADDREAIALVASPGRPPVNPPHPSVLVPTLVTDTRSALLRLSPRHIHDGSIRLVHDDLFDLVRPHVGEPWDTTFVDGVREGLTAADDLVRALGRKPKPWNDFAVGGVLGSPAVKGRSAGLPVALARLAAEFPAELKNPGRLVATGVIESSEGEYFVKYMPEVTAKTKLAAARQGRPAALDADERPTWLLAPVDNPIAGVCPVTACEHGGRRTLADAARALWGSDWSSFVDSSVRILRKRAELEVNERRCPLYVGPKLFRYTSASELKIVEFFSAIVDGVAADASQSSWGVLGDKDGSGRSWIVLGAAERLRQQGWHTLNLRVASSQGTLPDPHAVAELAKLQLPRGCARCLVTLDDVRFAEDAGDPTTIEEFVSVINNAGFHVLLVLDSRVRGWADNQFWDTTRAPLTVSGLSADEQDRLVAEAAKLSAVHPGMVEGRNVLARLHWIAVNSSAAVLDREDLDLTSLLGDKGRAFAVSAAMTLLGMRANARYLCELVADENVIAQLRELSVIDANAILNAVSIDNSRGAQAASTNALVYYLRWLLDPHRKELSDAAAILTRLRQETCSYALNRLLGRPGGGHGWLDWELIDSALESSNYFGVAQLVNALLQQGCVPRPQKRRLIRALALSIAGADIADMSARRLAWSLNILWQNCSLMDGTVLHQVRQSLSPPRIQAALCESNRISGRWRLVRELGHIFNFINTENARRDLLDVIERCHHQMFTTSRPDHAPELGAALLLHDEIERVRGVQRTAEDLAIDHDWIKPLIEQTADDTWRLDARFALSALQARFLSPGPDPNELASWITRTEGKWTIHELNKALAYLKASRPRLAEKVAYIALESGLSESLGQQITAVPPSTGAEMLFLLLRLAPAGTIGLHYELTADGYLPRREAVTSLAKQITRFADYKGVGRLFTALASEKREMTDLGSESLGQAVVDALSGEYLTIALRAARRSVALNLISAILDNDVVLDTSICQGLLNEVRTMVADGTKVQSSVIAAILVELLEAEELGQFRLPNGWLLADELCKLLDVKNIDTEMIHVTDEVMLSLLARLAKHLETKKCTPPAQWAATRYAKAFRRPGPGLPCMICDSIKTSEPVKVLAIADQMEAVLRRGSHENPRRAVQEALLWHWDRDLAPARRPVRVREPGQLAKALGLIASLEVPEALSRFDDEHIVTHLLRATPAEAGEIAIALNRADPDVAVRVREVVTESERGRILNRLTAKEHFARLRFKAFRQFELGRWKIDPDIVERLYKEAEYSAANTLSVPTMVEALRVVARMDFHRASHIARIFSTKNVAAAYKSRGRDREQRLALAGAMQAIYASETAAEVMRDIVERGTFTRLPPRILAIGIDRAMDVLPNVTADACLSHAEAEIDRLTSGYGVSADVQLTGIGDLASRLSCWYGGDFVYLDGVPTALDGKEAIANVLWALAFVDFEGHAPYWDAAMERLLGGEHPAGPNEAAQVLVALHRRDAVGSLDEQSLRGLMKLSANAGPTQHRLVRKVIGATLPPVLQSALASTAEAWQLQASAPWRRLHADNRHTKWIADQAKRLQA